MSNKPTLVLVPGAWHTTDTWNKITSLLEAQQHKCIPISLPTTAGNPSVSFGDDVKATRDAIIAETTQGHDVVVIVHSYGGMVGASAIKGLTTPKESPPPSPTTTTTPQPGHVLGLFMIACGFCQTGFSFLDGFGGKPPPIWNLDPSGFTILVISPRELFYHDLPEEEGDYWVSKLTKQSSKALTEGGEHSHSGWMDVPVWFLSTTEDKALPVEAQRMMVQGARDAGADVSVREVESSHSPMLSRPEETVGFVLEAVKAFVG